MKKIPLILCLIFLLAACLKADVITMKNGAKYGGIIIEYFNGGYILKARGKKYTIPENKIESIAWSATKAQVDEAFNGEKLHAKKKEKYSWVFTQAMAGCYLPLSIGTLLVPGQEMILFGASVGGFEKKFYWGVDILYGSMSGSLTYREPGAFSDSVTSLDSGNLMAIFNSGFRYVFEGLFFVPFTEIGFGLVINFDSLDNYPLGWQKYENYWSSVDPDMVDASAVSFAYMGMAARAVVGVDFDINNDFSMNLKTGLIAISKNRYDDLYAYDTAVEFLNMGSMSATMGIYISAGARMLF